MKQTKENVLKVMKAMQAHAHDMYRIEMENNDEAEAKKHLREAITIDSMMWLLTDKKYFNDMVEIFITEE